jgi:hypothetical protein
MALGKTADCDIGNGKEPWIKALGTPLESDHCHAEITLPVALSFEDADYIYHFCGPRRIEAWFKTTNVHGK